MIPNGWITNSAAIGAILSALGGMLTGVIDIPAGVAAIWAAIIVIGGARKMERVAKSNEDAVKLEKAMAVQAGVPRHIVEIAAPKKA